MVNIRQNDDEYCNMQLGQAEGYGFRAISRLADMIDYMITSDELLNRNYLYAREYVDDKMDELQKNIRNMNTSIDSYINNRCNVKTADENGTPIEGYRDLFKSADEIYSLAEETISHHLLLSEPFRGEIDTNSSNYWKGFFLDDRHD